MCYGDIREMDPQRQSIGDVVAETWTSAINTGILAAAFVLSVLLIDGVGVGPMLVEALGALGLGAAVYLAGVVVLAGLVRTRERTGLPVPSPSRHH